MVSIIVPKSSFDTGGPFYQLTRDPGQLKHVWEQISKILEHSFKRDEELHGKAFRERIQTQAELKRRADILGKWFEVLRKDYGLGVIRTLDELPKALKAEINGDDYKPPEKNRLWSPEGVTL